MCVGEIELKAYRSHQPKTLKACICYIYFRLVVPLLRVPFLWVCLLTRVGNQRCDKDDKLRARQLCNTNFFTSSRYAVPGAFACVVFAPSASLFPPLLPFPPPLRASSHLPTVIHLKLMSIFPSTFYRRREKKSSLSLRECAQTAMGWKPSDECSTPPYFPIHSAGVWCQDCCGFSHPQDMSYTLAVHLKTGEEEEEEGEENRTCRWKSGIWRRAGTSAARLWIDGDHRWRRHTQRSGDERTEIMHVAAAHSCMYSEAARNPARVKLWKVSPCMAEGG